MVNAQRQVHRVSMRLYSFWGFLHPCRNVALAMQYAPNIDVVVPLNVEDQMRIFLQRPETQSGKVQFVSISGEASAWMTADMTICLLQRINEAESGFRGIFAQVIVDCLVSVLPGQFTRNNGFGHYRRAPDLVALTFLRRLSK